MPRIPYKRYRPTKVSDGEGGFSETLGASSTLYGDVRYHEAETRMVVRKNSDVQIGDVVVIEEDR